MNTEIQAFNFNTAPLRTLTDENGDPWFVAKDVCNILEISNPSDALQSLYDDEKTNLGNSYVWPEPGRRPLIISEPGLYRLVMRSRKPEAKDFQRWVTHEDSHPSASMASTPPKPPSTRSLPILISASDCSPA